MSDKHDADERTIYAALRELPVVPELLSLNMHAVDVDVVDLNLRDWEANLAKEYAQSERTPMDSATVVRAFSRGWIFSTYELLRTWMQMTQRLLAIRKAARKKEKAGASADELKTLLGEFQGEADPSEWSGMSDPSWQILLEQALSSDQLAEDLEQARAEVAPVFAKLEALRVKLAKHELHGQKRAHLIDAGYVRIDSTTGTLGCLVEQKDGSSLWLTRQELADSLRELKLPKKH